MKMQKDMKRELMYPLTVRIGIIFSFMIQINDFKANKTLCTFGAKQRLVGVVR